MELGSRFLQQINGIISCPAAVSNLFEYKETLYFKLDFLAVTISNFNEKYADNLNDFFFNYQCNQLFKIFTKITQVWL